MALAVADALAVPEALGDCDLVCVGVSLGVRLELGDCVPVDVCVMLDEEDRVGLPVCEGVPDPLAVAVLEGVPEELGVGVAVGL